MGCSVFVAITVLVMSVSQCEDINLSDMDQNGHLVGNLEQLRSELRMETARMDQEMAQKIQQMETEMEQKMEQQIELKMKQNMEQMEQDMENMEQKMELKHKEEFAKLQLELVHTRAENCEKTKEIERNKEALSQYRNDDVMAALRDITYLRTKVDDLISYNSSNSATGVTAFSVTLGGGTAEYVGPSVGTTVIVFDEIQFVIGEGFDTLTSVFTAPVSGLYIFMNGNQNGNNGVSVTEIRVSGIIKRYNRIDTLHESGIQTALLMLTSGDQIYVELPPNQEIYCAACYFDGVLLYQSV